MAEGDFAATWAQFCETDREIDVLDESLVVTQDWSVGILSAASLLPTPRHTRRTG